MNYICELAGEKDDKYKETAKHLRSAINELMWDERNGFYYSVDLNLKPVKHNNGYHSGMPRNWSSVIQKIDVWSGFLAMWSGIADAGRADRMVKENMLNESVFCSPYGIRTLAVHAITFLIKPLLLLDIPSFSQYNLFLLTISNVPIHLKSISILPFCITP